MLDKKTYLSMKRYIKCMCRSHVKTLCENMELDDFEKSLVMRFYDGEKVEKTCIDLGISQPTYTVCLKTVMSKINDYKNTN